MALKAFKYTKESGDVSHRVVYPMHLFDDKMLSVDLTEFSDEERHEAEIILNAIHKGYINSIKEAGFASNFRSFFVDQMS